MTDEEIKKIEFKFVSHLAMEGQHSTVYEAVNVPFSLRMCLNVSMEYEEPKGRSTTHYMLNGKVFKTKEKLINALKAL